MTVDDEQDRSDLDLLLRGFQVSRMLRLVADLEVADKIDRDGSVGVEQIAAECSVLSEPLTRVLRALTGFGVFALASDGMVSHTPLSRLLRTDTPNSLHHSARFWTAESAWGVWGMLDAALHGDVPHEAAWHQGRFDYLRDHPDEARLFDQMMANFPDNRHAALAMAYDFSSANLIVDVGGGNGTTLRHILSRFANASGVVFDRDDVVAGLEAADESMHGRLTFQGGSFFDAVPTGGDVYLLMRVLHDWSDEDCVRILRCCRAAMAPTALLLVAEQLLDADPARGHRSHYLLDIQMMVMFGRAKERSAEDFENLFAAAGLATRRVISTASAMSIIETVPLPNPA